MSGSNSGIGVSPAAERHYDVRWWQPPSSDQGLTGQQYLYFNANGLVVLGLGPLHPLWNTTPHDPIGAVSYPWQHSEQDAAAGEAQSSQRSAKRSKVERHTAAAPTVVQAGAVLALFRSASDQRFVLVSPLAGQIVDVNARLGSDCASLLATPSMACWDGWCVIVQPASNEHRQRLLQTLSTTSSNISPTTPTATATSTHGNQPAAAT